MSTIVRFGACPWPGDQVIPMEPVRPDSTMDASLPNAVELVMGPGEALCVTPLIGPCAVTWSVPPAIALVVYGPPPAVAMIGATWCGLGAPAIQAPCWPEPIGNAWLVRYCAW